MFSCFWAPFLLAAIGSLETSRERANRVKCASNLRQIGQGIMIYAHDNKDLYPRTPFAPAAALDCTFAGAAAPNPFETGAVPVNCVPASYFLLVRRRWCRKRPNRMLGRVKRYSSRPIS